MRLLRCFVAGLLVLCAGSAQAALFIDDFNTGALGTVKSTTNGAVATGLSSGTNTLGGQRDHFAVVNTGGNPGTSGTYMNVDTSGVGFLSMGQDAPANGYTAMVWDGGDNLAGTGSGIANLQIDSAVGLGGIDLGQGGSNTRFMFNILSTASLKNMALTVFSSPTQFTRYTFDATDTLNGLVGFDFTGLNVVGFTNMNVSTGGGGGAAFTSVRAIALEIDPFGSGGDMAIDYFMVTIPEPGTFLLGGVLMLGGVYGVYHRRKAKAVKPTVAA